MWIEQLSSAKPHHTPQEKGIIRLSKSAKKYNTARQASNTCLAHTETNSVIPGHLEWTVTVPWVSEMENSAVELRNALSSSSFWNAMKIRRSSPSRVYAAYANCLSSKGATFSCQQIEKPLFRYLGKPFAAKAGMLAHSWQTTQGYSQ